jgi:hypothetical protein
MNEDAIKDAYDLFVNTGYNKSYDNFKALIQSNPNARKDAYDLFVSTGYNKTQKDFDQLMGIGAPAPVKKKEQVSPSQQKAQPTSLATGGEMAGGPSEPSASASNKSSVPLWLQNQEPQKQQAPEETLPFMAPKPQGINLGSERVPEKGPMFGVGKPEFKEPEKIDKNLARLETSLVDMDEEQATEKLKYLFGDLGFTFDQAGYGYDAITVTSPSGKKLDLSWDNFSSKQDEYVLGQLTDFISKESKAPSNAAKLEKYYEESNKKFVDQREINETIATLSKKSDDVNKLIKGYVVKRDALENEGKVLEETPENLRDANWESRYNNFVENVNKLEEERLSVVDYQNNFEANKSDIDKAVGKYMQTEEKMGWWGGVLLNSLLKSGGRAAASGTALFIDGIVNIMPTESLTGDYPERFVDAAKKLGYKVEDYKKLKTSLSEDQIEEINDKVDDELKKELKYTYGTLETARETNVKALGSDNVTKQYEAKFKEGFFGGAIAGLTESLPSMLGPSPARVLSMYSNITDNVSEEMENDPTLSKLSETEKSLVSVPIGIVSAILEEFGLRNVVANKGLLNKLVMRMLGKVSPGVTSRTFAELVRNDVESMVARGLLTVGGAALAEFETGAAQEASEQTIKAIYNKVKGDDVFKQIAQTPYEFIGDIMYAGAQEAVGGFVLGSIPAVSAAYRKTGFEGMSDIDFEKFERIANDDKVESAFVTSLKTQINSGEISVEDAKQTLNDYRKSRGLYKQLPDNLTTENKKKAMNLLRERQGLDQQISGKDDALVKPQKARIEEINSLLETISKPERNAVQESGIEESASRIEVLEKKYNELAEIVNAQDRRVGQPSTKEEKELIVVLDELNKLKEDAIQEQTTSEVPVQSETRPGEEVVEGKPQPEPQVAAEEGQEKVVIPAGKRLFNEPNPETVEISKTYKEKNNIAEPEGVKIEAVDVDNASKIADAYEALQDTPNDPEVQDAYNAMADETAKQHQDIVDAGYEVEIWQGEGEPYANAQEMIDDVKNNKHMFIYSTEQGFGDAPITEEQRKQNKLLQDSGFKDKTGKTLLYNDLFRFVHDFFGHTERGNGFGPVGEENAWDVHARMYTPKARRAMTTETRGQNSWVNFGPQMRNEDGSLKKKGDAGYLSPKDRQFAPQKMALMPEEFSQIVEATSNFEEAINKSAQSLNMVAPGLKIIIAENTDDAQMQIAEALSAVAPSQASDVAAGFTTETRGQTVFVNGKPYAMVFNKETADSVTAGHEVWETLLNDAFSDDQARMKELVDSIDAQLRAQGFEDIADKLDAFASQRGYEAVKYSEYMAELGGMLVASGFGKGPLTAQQKTLLQKIGDIINKFAELFTGKKQFLDQATPEDILGFMITISEKVSKGEDISQFFRQEPGTIIDQNDVSINTRDSKKQKFENNEYEVPQKVYNPKGGMATGFTFIADRMRTGEWTGLNPNSGINIKLMGGIGYPMLKKLFKKAGWAVDGGSVMSSFLNKIVKSQTGVGFPVIMSEYSHVSNLTFAKIFEAEMDWMVKNKEISKKEQLDNVNDFIASSLIGKKDLSPKLKENPKTGLMEDKNANAPLRVFTTEKNGVYTPKTYKSIEDVYKELETTFGARALFMQNMIGVGVKNRYAKIDKYKFPDMVRVADETADPRLKGVPSGSAVSAIQFDQKKAKQFVDDIGSNKDLKKFHSASAVGVDPHISYEYVVEGSSLGWLPGVVDLAEAEGVEPDTKEWYDEQRAKYKEGSISEAQLRSNVTAKARASMPEVTIKTKSQKSVPPIVDEVLTDDGKGNYIFVHYSDEKRDAIKPMSGSKRNFTSREEVSAISSVGGVAMYYTKRGQKEQGVGNVPNTVIVPKDKVYFYGSTEKGTVFHDPEGFEEEARTRFQAYRNRGNESRPTKYAFDANNSAAWVTKVAAENGYDMLVTNWGGPKSYRAQTTKELKTEEEYTGFKEIPDDVFEVGDEVFVYSRYGNITNVDGNVLTIDQENAFGRFDTMRFTVTDFNKDKILLIEKAKPTVTTRSQKVDVTVIPGYERMMGEVEGIIEKTLSRGGSYNQASAAAIGYIQKSAVYERADDSQREQIIRDFKKIRGEKMKAAPSVARIMGEIKDTKEVTVKEKTALKDQIKLEAKAAKDAVAYVKQLRTQISTALRGMSGRGVISAKQATAILARYDKMNILNPVMRDRFVDYMSNVLQTAEYLDKIREASKLRKSIKKASKSADNQAEVSKMAKGFAGIDPSRVENIDQYIENATQVLNSAARKTGDPLMRNPVNMANMANYIEQEMEIQNEQIKNEILSKYQELVDAGVLSSDMTINEIKRVVAAIEENDSDAQAKVAKAKEALKGMMEEISPVIMQMVRTGEDPFTGEPIELTYDEKKALKSLTEMDLDNLSLADAVKVVEYANNFVANGITSGIVGITELYNGSLEPGKLVKKGFKSIPIRKYFMKGAGKVWAEGFATLPMLNKLYWGDTRRAIEVSEASGVTGISNGKAKALRIVDKAAKEYIAKFAKAKDFLASENVLERGMVAFMSRGVIGDEFQAQDEYNRRKSLIEETIQALKDPENSTDLEIAKGEVAQKVYDKILKDSKNAEDVRSKASKTNVDAVDWWINEWSKYYDQMDEVSRNVYNTELSRDINYTPDRFQMKEAPTATEEDFESSFFGNFEYVDTSKSGSLKKNNRIKNLPEDKNGVKKRIVNLDFDINNVNALTNALVDVETAGSVMKVKGFVTSKDFSKLFSSKEDRDLYKKRIVKYVSRVKGGSYVDQNELVKMNKVINAIASFGVAKALFSLSQPLKQFVPPMLNTLTQTGRFDIAELFKGGMEFIDNSGYPIANRGVGSQGELKSINRKLVEAEKNLALRGLDGVAEFSNAALELTLKNPDIYAARASWISFYMSELKKQGIKPSSINWSTHKLNKQAADYAQSMVDSQQNISDTDMQGEIFASKQPATVFLRRALLPLMTFTLNQKTRIWADIRTIGNEVSSKEDKLEAKKSLAGALVELTAFSAIAFGVKELLYMTAQAIFGVEEDDEEEEKKKRMMRQSASTAQNFLRDFFLPPIPGMDAVASGGVNILLDESGLSETIPQKWFDIEDEEARFNLYDKQNQGYLDMLGTQGIAAEKALELAGYYDMAIDGKFTKEYNGNKVEKQVLEEDRKAAALNALVMSGYYGGLLPSDIAYVVGIINKKIQKRAETAEEED